MNKKHEFRIPEPCHEDWNKMTPTQKGRFCDSCAKEVKDFSQSEPEEIAETILNSSAKVCGRFRKDQIVSPAPKLIDLIPTRPAHAAKVAAAALAFFSCDIGVSQGEPQPTLRGKVAYAPVLQADSERIIRGVVLDENGAVLPFANVYYLSDHGAQKGVSADLEGKFELNISTSDFQGKQIDLHVSYIGYEERVLSVILKDEQHIEVRLDGSDIFIQGLMIATPPPSKKEPQEEIEIIDMMGDVEVIEVIEEEEVDYIEGEVAYIPEEKVSCETSVSEIIEEETSTAAIQQGEFLKGDTIIVQVDELIEVEPSQAEEAMESTAEAVESSQIKALESNLIQIYPNPTTNFLIVAITEKRVSPYQIFDATGKLVFAGTLSESPMLIDVDVMENGNYFFIVSSLDGVIHSKQFIVAR